MRAILMVCLVAGCGINAPAATVDSSVINDSASACLRETTDCRQLEAKPMNLVAFVCPQSEPDPTGFVCFTPHGWIDERCCLATH